MPESEPEGSESRDLSRVPAHLRSSVFKPGQSGNPGGMPQGTPTTVSAVLKEAMKRGGVEVAVQSALEILGKPNHRHWLGAFKEIMDRTEGKVADRIHHELKRFEEGIELKDGRRASGPVPLPKVVSQPAQTESGAARAVPDDPAGEDCDRPT